MSRRGFRSFLALIALFSALAFVATEADARVRGSVGSRGTRTFSAPPPTATAPNRARLIERSMTQPGQSGAIASRPATAAQPGGFFSRPGFLGGLAAGFLGAGLLGLLFGNGLFGGLGGFASILGLLLQIALVVIVARLLWSWWQRRQQPALAGGPSLRDIDPQATGGTPAHGAGAAPSFSTGFGAPEIKAEDFNAFERLLGEIQTAYSKEDLANLRTRLTPEMLSYFSEELAQNASRGVVNRISDVKLLQGDLAEAWSEGDAEYATVAMRYSLVDEMVERESGRVIGGGPDEATEIWTFRRARGGNWILSAIQQTG